MRFLLTDAAGVTLGSGSGTHLSLTMGAFFAALAVALSVDDLGTVFGVIGGTTGELNPYYILRSPLKNP